MNYLIFLVLLLIPNISISATITHGGTLPDSSQKSDFYAIIDSATLSGIVNADVSNSAAIVASKLDLSSPGGIGSTAANTGAFTTLSATGKTTFTLATGNVGVGSTNPGMALDVTGTVRSTSFIQTGSSINSLAGNVGIGSTNPGTALDVNGTVRASNFSGVGGLLGAWVSKSTGTNYQATTDGIMIFSCSLSSSSDISCISDSSSTPTTVRARAAVSTTGGSQINCTIPVRRNDYYKATVNTGCDSTTVYFVPLGS